MSKYKENKRFQGSKKKGRDKAFLQRQTKRKMLLALGQKDLLTLFGRRLKRKKVIKKG